MKLSSFLGNPWLCWGVGPYLSSALGYFLTVAVLEVVIRTKAAAPLLISYGKTPRLQEIDTLRETVAPFGVQLRTSAMHLLGPNGIVNCIILSMLASQFICSPDEGTTCNEWATYPDWVQWACGMAAMVVINDGALYWGHRIQHESDFLWRHCHMKHHSIGIPSPVSTVYIDPIDATLQGAIPMMLAALLVRPHPITFYTFVFQRVSENCLNHSGLDSKVADVLFLKCLFGRAAVAHHDAHHRFSNYSRNAKNYGEAFWVWDWLFGTLSSTTKLGRKIRAAE